MLSEHSQTTKKSGNGETEKGQRGMNKLLVTMYSYMFTVLSIAMTSHADTQVELAHIKYILCLICQLELHKAV